jgi:hypothetical protein
MVDTRAFGQNYCQWKKLKGKTCTANDEETYGATMYPLLDLINHSPTPVKYKDDPYTVINTHF